MPRYLDDAQARDILARRASWRWRSEWPTWLVIGALYGVALNASALDLPVALALLAVLSCWYMSLQHELLHGHPTCWPFVNMLFGLAPLADAHLTEPGRDPESYFVTSAQWAGASLRLALAARNTFAGRVLIVIEPLFLIAASWCEAARAVAERQWRIVGSWIVHGAALVLLAYWLDARCGIHGARSRSASAIRRWSSPLCARFRNIAPPTMRAIAR